MSILILNSFLDWVLRGRLGSFPTLYKWQCCKGTQHRLTRLLKALPFQLNLAYSTKKYRNPMQAFQMHHQIFATTFHVPRIGGERANVLIQPHLPHLPPLHAPPVFYGGNFNPVHMHQPISKENLYNLKYAFETKVKDISRAIAYTEAAFRNTQHLMRDQHARDRQSCRKCKEHVKKIKYYKEQNDQLHRQLKDAKNKVEYLNEKIKKLR